MILPMKKVSLVVMDKDREKSLEKLRDVGVVHLERKTVSSENLSKLLERKAKLENALAVLRPFAEEQKKAKAKPAPVAAPADGLVLKVLELSEAKKQAQEKAAALGRERSRIEAWGNFDPAAFAALAEQGVKIFLYKLSQAEYDALPGGVRFKTLGADKAAKYLLVFDEEIPGVAPFALPEKSLAETDRLIAEAAAEAVRIDGELAKLAGGVAPLETEEKKLFHEIEFETARAGMEALEDAPAESTVAWLSGFVPEEDLGRLKRAAAEHGWALAASDPGPDDNVPTKLKNSRFASLLRPLTDFLEVTPGYHEIDISLWFLIFFVIFFGMIFGDAGYGAIVLLAGLVGMIATAKKGTPPVLKLLALLGFSNFVWGVLTCSWFGVDVSLLPEVLKKYSLPLISNATAAISDHESKIVQQNLMIFCFTLALLQLSIGHILAIIHDRSLKILANLGNIAMLGGMYFIILSLIASNEARKIPLYTPALYVFAAGFVLNFVFASYEGSIGKSILESCKNIISVILGIANVFSDIMSYIRLWAVGLAGAAIAGTVNTMAGPMLGHLILFVFGVALLVFGHGLNLVLNVLSVLVHGVRLNTLEFSGHVGLTWAGTPYKPFAAREHKAA